ncbi:MAG: hypothetical protein Q9182_001285 [Xanthomendoza sp. 2 TL-2023]
MLALSSDSFTNKGLKRKAVRDHDFSSKKPRNVPTAPIQTPLSREGIRFGSSAPSAHIQDPNIDSEDSSSDSEIESTSITPLTSISSTSSPRFPSELKTHVCTYNDCGKAFNRPAKLAQHIRSHTNTRLFVCPHKPCTKDFLRQSHLTNHVKSAHSDVRDYICDREGCEKRFVTATRLKRHRAAHEGRLKCQCTVLGCGETFRKHGTLHKHVMTVHEGRRPFACEMQDESGQACGQGFSTAGKLRAHAGRVHGGQRFWCSICILESSSKDASISHGSSEDIAGFSTYAQLQEHIKMRHPPECGICGLVCSSQRELKSHVEVRHGTLSVDDRKTYRCPEPGCVRAFTKRGNLNIHIEATHKSKKYICGVVPRESLNNVEGWDGLNACGRAVTTKGSLQTHIRTVHMGIERRRRRKTKTAEDDPIDYYDGQTSNLMMLTGAGYDDDSRRHIPCLMPDCNFRFSRGYDLQNHLTTRHGLVEDEADTLTAGTEGNRGSVATGEQKQP